MALSDILTGNIIYADDINLIVARLPIRARSTTATTFTSSTTLGNVTGLGCAMTTSNVYKLRGRIKVTGANATHDVKFHMALPAATSIEWSVYAMTASQTANPVSVDMGASTGDHIRGTIAGTLVYVLDGFITTTGTAGTAQLQAAQNTLDAGTLSIDAGSEMSLQLWF